MLFRSTSQSWLSIIVNSDLFQAKLAARRADLASEVGATVRDRLGGLAGQSLEAIGERIEREKEKIPIGELRETAEMALHALGYGGAKSAPAGGTTYNFNNFQAVAPDVLADARGKLRVVQASLRDATPSALPPPLQEVLPPFQEAHEHDHDNSLPSAGPLQARR